MYESIGRAKIQVQRRQLIAGEEGDGRVYCVGWSDLAMLIDGFSLHMRDVGLCYSNDFLISTKIKIYQLSFNIFHEASWPLLG